MGVMYQHVVDGVAVLADFDRLEQEAVGHDALLVLLAEEHLLSVAQVDGAVGAELLVGDCRMDAVVVDHAVLENLDHRGAFVAGAGEHDLTGCGQVHVDGAGEEVAPGSEHQFGGDEGVFGGAVGRRLGDESAR